MNSKFFFLYLLLATGAHVYSVPPLERIVTVSFQQEPVASVLMTLAQQANFTFSYNPNILPSQTITQSFQNKSVREILNQIFDGSIKYKERGNYIILTKTFVSETKNVSSDLTVSGYVRDLLTDKKLQYVSVYEKSTISGTVTDQFGFFKLKIDKPEEAEEIHVSRNGYRDTTFQVNRQTHELIQLVLQPIVTEEAIIEEKKSKDKKVTIEELRSNDDPDLQRTPDYFLDARAARANMLNIRDTLHRKYQVSFFPFVGSNHRLSGNVINDYSFNIIGGYSMGTRKLELGGVFNIDRGDVSGFQGAGTFNYNRGYLEGVQVAGNMNFNGKGFHGFQGSGLLNFSGRASVGTQLAGLVNIQLGDLQGFQATGCINIGSGTVKGVQLSGLLNVAHTVDGAQIGLINISDSIRGIPFGLFSFVTKGYHTLEVSSDEIFQFNIAIRSGVKLFYNILAGGVQPGHSGNKPFWSVGYGIGTMPRISDRVRMNFDFTTNHIGQKDLFDELNLLNKFYLGVDVKLIKGISVTGGLTFNAYLSDHDNTLPSVFEGATTPTFLVNSNFDDDINLKTWWGFKVGARFF